jgi:hypothetical protein
MRMRSQTISLGQHQWSVRPLTIAQVQAIEPLLFAQEEGGTLAAAIAVLRVALARDHADKAADLETIEAGAPEIAAAMASVLRLGGFLPEKDPSPGEAEPGKREAG